MAKGNLEVHNPFFKKGKNYRKLRFHVFGVPHNPAHEFFSLCASAQKTRFFCWMLKSTGHEVIHYGNELSVDKEQPDRGVFCDEHVSVTTQSELMDAYPNYRKNRGHIDYFNPENPESVSYLNQIGSLKTVHEVKKRYEQGDYFCYMVAPVQQSIYEGVSALPVRHIEVGVSYLADCSLPYRIFESPGVQGWHYGMFGRDVDAYRQLNFDERGRYGFFSKVYAPLSAVPMCDAVIPGTIDFSQFDFRVKKDDILLYLGRVHEEKGIAKAVKIAERVGKRLIIAGPGDYDEAVGIESKNIEVVGVVGPKKRRELLSKASGVFVLSTYWEPFGFVHLEAMASGTPPIVSDVGGLVDTVRSGYNGYRLNMNQVEQGVWACKNLDKIDPYNLRDFALRFSKEQNALRYNEYFQGLECAILSNDDVLKIENPERESLHFTDFDSKIKWPEGWMTPVDEKEFSDAC